MGKNLTQGNVLKSIIYFSLPYFLSYFLQTLYGMADLYIISQYDETTAITAVSVGSQVMNMITVMIVGLAMGSTIMIGRSVGEENSKKTALCIGNTITAFIIASIAITAITVFFSNGIVAIMSTPTEAVSGTKDYLIICFIGIPFITAYNIISSIFRGLGDSKSPMYFIAIACISNILLDYLFIGFFKMGPAGAALGTTLSQAISVLFSSNAIIRKKSTGIKLKKSDFKVSKKIITPIVKVGFPIALQDGFIQISFLIITIIANLRGLNDAAAVGIVEKIIGMIFLVPSSMLSSVSALSAQNVGAGKHNRAKQTLKYAIIITVSFETLVTVFVLLNPSQLIKLFEENPEVIRLGSQYLSSYVIDCIFAGIHFCFSGYFCAYGKSEISFLHNCISIIFARIPISFIMSKLFTNSLFPMGLASPIGSILSTIVCIIAYIILKRKNYFGNKTIAPAN